MPSPDAFSPADGRARGPADVERLLTLIAPEAVGADRFAIDISEHVEGHLFGGLVAAQALHTAYATVDAPRQVQSAHAYFLRRGRPELPIEFEVHRDTDGRSFSARRVAATQEGLPIFTMVCSFHVPEDTVEVLIPMPDDVPPPAAMAIEEANDLGGCFEVRRLLQDGDGPWERRTTGRLWVRAASPLPDDQVVHDCVAFCASDLGTAWNILAPHHMRVLTSLDHAVWLHRRTRMDEWHHIDLEPSALSDARGLYTGKMWHRDGTQVASLAQENLLRPRTD